MIGSSLSFDWNVTLGDIILAVSTTFAIIKYKRKQQLEHEAKYKHLEDAIQRLTLQLQLVTQKVDELYQWWHERAIGPTGYIAEFRPKVDK